MWRDVATQLVVALGLAFAPPVGRLIARLVRQQLTEGCGGAAAPLLFVTARPGHADQRTAAALTTTRDRRATGDSAAFGR